MLTNLCSFTGDLVISINPGLDITIPNHELVRSFVDLNATTGQEYISDSSKRVMGMYAEDSQTANSILALGRTFLTGAYLMVNADERQFTIWKGQSSAEQKLIGSGPPICPDAGATAPAPPAASQTASVTGISKGAIAGTIVSVIFLLALGAGIAYFILRRRSRNAEMMHNSDDKPQGSGESSRSCDFQKPELSSDHQVQAPQEMSSGGFPGVTIPPFEMNGIHKMQKSAEMASNEAPAQELHGDGQGPVSPVELPSTPKSQLFLKKKKKLPPKPGLKLNGQSIKSNRTSKRKPLPGRLSVPRSSSGDGTVSPL